MNGYVNRNQQGVMILVYGIIALCVLCFLGIDPNSSLYRELTLSGYGLESGKYYQLITCMFLHGNFGHILFNMIGLYLFSTMLAYGLKPYQFLILYFLSGLMGSLLFILTAEPYVGCVGASGAVCGLAMAAAMLNPYQKIMLLLAPVPIKMKTFVWVYIIVSLFMGSVQLDNVAHYAHLGGLIAGYIVLRVMGIYRWDPLGFIFKKGNKTADLYKAPSTSRYDRGMPQGEKISPRDIDRLLAKVAQHGINSLTPEEYEILRQARERYKKN